MRDELDDLPIAQCPDYEPLTLYFLYLFYKAEYTPLIHPLMRDKDPYQIAHLPN